MRRAKFPTWFRSVRLVWVTVVVAQLGVLSPLALTQARAAELEYPELNMVPRNSERLETEAKNEGKRMWGVVIPMAVSPLVTIAAGVAMYNPFETRSVAPAWTGIGVGAVGLLLATGVLLLGAPYQSAVNEMNATTKSGTMREKLLRERFAEEEIQAAGRMGNRLRFLAGGLQLLGNGFIFVSCISKSNSISPAADAQYTIAMAVSGVGMVAALAPIFFKPYWVDVADEQDSYRKRIFAPVAAGPTLLPTPDGKALAPGLLMSWAF